MISAETGWVKVAESVAEIRFGPNGIAELDVAGKRICIARFKDDLFAVAHKCPHAGGRFMDGFIDALGNVVCPVHRYKFCLRNGHNVSGEGYYLKHWPVKIEDGVFIKFDVF